MLIDNSFLCKKEVLLIKPELIQNFTPFRTKVTLLLTLYDSDAAVGFTNALASAADVVDVTVAVATVDVSVASLVLN